MSNFTTTKHLALTSAFLVVLTAAACSTQNNGKPSAAETTPASNSTSDPGSSGSTPAAAAPRVSRPLKVDKFTADPCLSLTATQLSDFSADPQGRRVETGNGIGCQWNAGADKLTGIGANFYPKITDGLSHIYQQNAAGFFKGGYFQPTTINGYPATFNNVSDNRKGGDCSLTVAVSDQSIFDALILGKAGTDACKAAANVAKAVLQTIQEGQ